jgi:hypothetical protein
MVPAFKITSNLIPGVLNRERIHSILLTRQRPVKEETNRMNEETFNLSIRRFLKMVGIGSQREIERAVVKALEDGRITGSESFPATVTLEVAGLNLNVKFDGEIKLE